MKNKKQEQYDIAKFEMYKISTRYDCNCQKIEFFELNGKTISDTIAIISMNLVLDTLYFRGDSATYLFSFYNRNKTEFSYTINDKYNSCPNYYGIEFFKDSEFPYRYLIAESSYLNREAVDNFNLIDSSFYECLIENKKIANKWLLDYLNIR